MVKYNKLIRDNVPEIIKQTGKIPVTHIASEKEYQEKLIEKLDEEGNEFLKKENKPHELADILEVVHALCEIADVEFEHVEDLRKRRAIESGTFEKRIILDEVKDA
jgi:predicted house-cleaning noncanonical NTP pyrophosphatase (MazG superfamily)